MSRVSSSPVVIPAGVDVSVSADEISVKGTKGALNMAVHSSVSIRKDGDSILFEPKDGSKSSGAMAGTTRALVNNMVVGASVGFEKRLQLVGVGYRAKASGNTLNLTLGFSHPVDYVLPSGVAVDTPTQTEVVLSSADKQLLGQVAAEIRAFRPPEPYKGKGVRYADEYVRRKEAKKK
ncbi:MAG: 50S ribosomal protein L6 [Pseudomonadales bacterium]|nr:50S ribosomal protein L6 [Pseudomonadales bacterium]